MKNNVTIFIEKLKVKYNNIDKFEKNLFEIRKTILNNNDDEITQKDNSNRNNNNNNNTCFICHKHSTNLKLRQIESSTRMADEIISSHLICENCFISPILD